MFNNLTKALIRNKNKTLAEKVKKVEARAADITFYSDSIRALLRIQDEINERVPNLQSVHYSQVPKEERDNALDYLESLRKDLAMQAQKRIQDVQNTFEELVKGILTDTAHKYYEQAHSYIEKYTSEK